MRGLKAMTDNNSLVPNFIVVGAARSGTTSVYHWLDAHPQVYMSPVKETNYFLGLDSSFAGPGDIQKIEVPRSPSGEILEKHAAIVTSWEDYVTLFSDSSRCQARGEVSPSYLYYQKAAISIRETLPDCKILIILRNPIERAFSNYKALIKAGREYLDFESALKIGNYRINEGWEHFWDLRGLGLYYSQVKRYLDLFPKEQVGVWLYEDMRADPICFFAKLCNFIGVDNTFVPDASVRHNHGKVRLGIVKRFLLNYPAVSRCARLLIPDYIRKFFSSLDNSLGAESLTMKQETREDLLRYYYQDILRLHDLILDLDVVQWIEEEERR